MVSRRVATKRKKDRLPKTCHRVIIKFHETGYLAFSGREAPVAFAIKRRILDKIEKPWTKMSRDLGAMAN
jgi:hypothetical protein